MSCPRYEASDDTFAAKEILKTRGFKWDPTDKRWFLVDGHGAELCVKSTRAALKAEGIDCNIIYNNGEWRPPEV